MSSCIFLFVLQLCIIVTIVSANEGHTAPKVIKVSTRHEPIAGLHVIEEHGIVFGEATISCVSDLIACRVHARSNAINKLLEAAATVGANYVLGTQLVFERMSENEVLVTAYGTACTVSNLNKRFAIRQEADALGSPHQCAQLDGGTQMQQLGEDTCFATSTKCLTDANDGLLDL